MILQERLRIKTQSSQAKRSDLGLTFKNQRQIASQKKLAMTESCRAERSEASASSKLVLEDAQDGTPFCLSLRGAPATKQSDVHSIETQIAAQKRLAMTKSCRADRSEASASSKSNLEDPSQRMLRMTSLFACHVKHSETSSGCKSDLAEPPQWVLRGWQD